MLVFVGLIARDQVIEVAPALDQLEQAPLLLGNAHFLRFCFGDLLNSLEIGDCEGV